MRCPITVALPSPQFLVLPNVNVNVNVILDVRANHVFGALHDARALVQEGVVREAVGEDCDGALGGC